MFPDVGSSCVLDGSDGDGSSWNGGDIGVGKAMWQWRRGVVVDIVCCCVVGICCLCKVILSCLSSLLSLLLL